jgi:hypothetical protein
MIIDKGNKSTPSNAIVKQYEPTPGEVKATKAWLAQRERKNSAPRMKATNNKGPNEIALDHADQAQGPTSQCRIAGRRSNLKLTALPGRCPWNS